MYEPPALPTAEKNDRDQSNGFQVMTDRKTGTLKFLAQEIFLSI